MNVDVMRLQKRRAHRPNMVLGRIVLPITIQSRDGQNAGPGGLVDSAAAPCLPAIALRPLYYAFCCVKATKRGVAVSRRGRRGRRPAEPARPRTR